jgi:hypothetical protein
MAPEQVAEARKVVDEAAVKVGRDPADVRGVYNLSGIDGPPQLWVETLARWVDELSVTTFILPAESVEQVELFAGEVVPGVRAALA